MLIVHGLERHACCIHTPPQASSALSESGAGAGATTVLNGNAFKPALIAMAFLILSAQTPGPRDPDFSLYNGTLFDWYIAEPEDRLATSVMIIAQHFFTESRDGHSRMKYAAAVLADCLNRKAQSTGSELLAEAASDCVARIRADGVFK